MASNHGGARKGAGRKPKSEEHELIEKLRVHDEKALNALIELIDEKDFRAVQLFMQYRFGKPKENIDITSDGEGVNIPPIVWVKRERE